MHAYISELVGGHNFQLRRNVEQENQKKKNHLQIVDHQRDQQSIFFDSDGRCHNQNDREMNGADTSQEISKRMIEEGVPFLIQS